RTAERAAVEVDAVGGEQPLAAQLGPVAIGVGLEEVAGRQARRVRAEGLLGLREGNAEEGGGHGATLNEFTTVEHEPSSHSHGRQGGDSSSGGPGGPLPAAWNSRSSIRCQ